MVVLCLPPASLVFVAIVKTARAQVKIDLRSHAAAIIEVSWEMCWFSLYVWFVRDQEISCLQSPSQQTSVFNLLRNKRVEDGDYR